MRPVNPSADDAPIRIGAKLRSSRLSQGITIEQLAGAAGLTKGFVSRIERDETMPSVPTLVQLCQVLSLPIGHLFEAPDVQRIALDDAPFINMGGTGAIERLITPRGEDRVQAIRSTMHPNATGGESLYTVNCNVESLHVVSGELELEFADQRMALTAGDTVTFPGNAPHTWHTGDVGAEVLWVLVPAAWSGSA